MFGGHRNQRALVAGLPGTGKTLVSKVLEARSVCSFGGVEDTQTITRVAKEVCEELYPGQYPYYLVHEWGNSRKTCSKKRNWDIFPQGVTLAFTAAFTTFLYNLRPLLVVYCRRDKDAWISQARKANPPQDIDLGAVYECDAEWSDGLNFLGLFHATVLTFNVDTMLFGPDYVVKDTCLQQWLEEELFLNPKLGL